MDDETPTGDARGRLGPLERPAPVLVVSEHDGHVLVVEDHPTASGVLCAYLCKLDFNPRIAPDGAAALHEWIRWKPDLGDPGRHADGQTGLGVLQRRRSDDVGATVIILSASGHEEDRLLGLEVGADDYVANPFSPPQSRPSLPGSAGPLPSPAAEHTP